MIFTRLLTSWKSCEIISIYMSWLVNELSTRGFGHILQILAIHVLEIMHSLIGLLNKLHKFV